MSQGVSNKALTVVLISVPVVLGLPILGIGLAGLPVSRYLEFPPLTQFVRHRPFSWIVFFVYLVIIAGLILPFLLRATSFIGAETKADTTKGRFPLWGWIGIICGLGFWSLAWTRFSWFSLFQAHTFTPLWISFIVTVNALCFWRKGRSLMTHNSRYFLCLFPTSAAFWWFFEYLNRFVQNWHYTGIKFSPISYGIYACISFSTVLPAVLSVRELVGDLSWIQKGFSKWVVFRPINNKLVGLGGLIAGGLSLALIGIYPNLLFPLLWVAPLVVLVSVQILTSQRHVLSGLARGDWTIPVSAALAAAICGWFWEMWNYLSLARWEYVIPFVDRFYVFEMPILGYAGYFPFGIECIAVGELLRQLLMRDSGALN